MQDFLFIIGPIIVALIALRAWMNAKSVVIEDYEDALLGDRTLRDETMTARLGRGAERLGLAEVLRILKDLMVAGDLKRALAEGALARAEGRARHERARGETAALRNMTNAAKRLEQHAGLAHSRLLEVATTAAESTGNQLVLRLDRDAPNPE